MTTKVHIAKRVAKETGIPIHLGVKAVVAVFNAIAEELKKPDGHFQVNGFGRFSVRNRAARTARNPKTGEPAEVKAKRVPHFKSSDALRAVVNGEEPPACQK